MNQLLEVNQKRAAFVDQLNLKKKGLLAEAEAIHSAAVDGSRPLTVEERSSFEAKLKEVEDINGTIELDTRAGNLYSDATPKTPRVEVHDNWTDNPHLFGRKPDTGESVNARRARIAFGFGEQLLAIKNAELIKNSASNAKVDERLYELQKRAASGSSEAVPADGGFLLQPDFAADILMNAHDTGLIYPRCRTLPISDTTNAIRLPAIDESSRVDGSRWGGVRMYWENEADALVGSKPKFALLEMITKKLTGLYYATSEVLTDARLLGAVVSQAFSEEMAFKMDDGVIRGTGAGQLAGILNAPALVTVAKTASQGAATVVTDNILSMWARLWPRSRSNAVWFMNTDVEQVLYKLFINGAVDGGTGTGGLPVFMPAGGLTGNMYSTLFGRPIVIVEQCETLGTVGDIILADLNQYLMLDKGAMQTAVSMHVRFLNDEQTFRWIYRTDGQPWWKTALTPFKGSKTLSPFVCLATR